jgi:hypothetical protein
LAGARGTSFAEDTHSHFDAARTALDSWLKSKGFEKVPRPYNYAPDASNDVTWYEEVAGGSECFYVRG